MSLLCQCCLMHSLSIIQSQFFSNYCCWKPTLYPQSMENHGHRTNDLYTVCVLAQVRHKQCQEMLMSINRTSFPAEWTKSAESTLNVARKLGAPRRDKDNVNEGYEAINLKEWIKKMEDSSPYFSLTDLRSTPTTRSLFPPARTCTRLVWSKLATVHFHSPTEVRFYCCGSIRSVAHVAKPNKKQKAKCWIKRQTI